LDEDDDSDCSFPDYPRYNRLILAGRRPHAYMVLQRISTSSSSTPSTRSSPPSRVRPMLPRATPWSCSMIATATGGSSGLSRIAALVGYLAGKYGISLTGNIRISTGRAYRDADREAGATEQA
jgi:hypothetical protein